jgi:hypothetical protein
MIEENFPDFFVRADRHANSWQRRYLISQKVQLSALLCAAAIATAGDYPLVTAVLFGLGISAQVYRLSTRADEKWWNGRAGAESAKTASWLFVVGGRPFDLENSNGDVELATRLSEVAAKVANFLPIPSSQAHVTPEMYELRSRALADRIAIYQRDRIESQCSWYASKSETNEKRARLWSLAGISAQALGLALGIVAAAGGWAVDVVGLFAALAASAVAWVAVKQYETLARSYAVASAELSVIRVEITNGVAADSWTEDKWSTFANDAEEAISREHTSWRAARAT